MPINVIITKDFNHMSEVAAGIVEKKIITGLKDQNQFVLGLATGNSPTGLYKHLAKLVNSGKLDSTRIRSFNLDEYIGLPGENAQQRTLHPESYCYFMIQEFFSLLDKKFIETSVPYGSLIDQQQLINELEANPEDWKELGIIGVGGRGHVAFHESGIPFEDSSVLLVKLDENTVENAVKDGHFFSKEESPWYAISMGAELVYKAKTVILLAIGERKVKSITKSLLNDPSPQIPISYGQIYSEKGGNLIYIIDKSAGRELLSNKNLLEQKGIEINILE